MFGSHTDWVDVQEHKDTIKKQVKIGRFAASELGKYTQMRRAVDRTGIWLQE